MPLSECKLFRDVAKTRSLSRAAAANGISQPAATQQIQELERRFGHDLLDRRTRPLGLTEAGQMYYEFCRDVLRREDELLTALEQLSETATGELRVASIYSVALTEMPRVSAQFAKACPRVELKLEYLRPDRVYEAVRSDTADLGLVSYPEPARDLAVIPWRDEAMAVAFPPDHRLAHRRSVRPRDLEGEEFVAFDEDLPIRKDIDRFLRTEDVGVRVTMHFDNIQMIKEAVALRHGISILPDRTMQNEIEQGRLRTAALTPGLVRPVGVVHRKRKTFNRAATAFLRALPVKQRST